MATFYDHFRECAERWPTSVALAIQRGDRVESYTYAEVKRMAESVGRWLIDNRFEPGARIAILADNHPRWVIAYLGIIAGGSTTVPLDTALHPDQIAKLLEDSGSTLVFCDHKHWSLVAQAIHGLKVRAVLTDQASAGSALPAPAPAGDFESIFAVGPGTFLPQ